MKPKSAAPALEMQKQNTTLAARIPDPSVPRARLVLKLFAEASGGTVIHTEETFIDNTASWSWQQLSVGKLATVDCWAEVYVENLAGVPVWFDDLEIAAGGQPVALVVQETHYDPWGLELAGIGYNAPGNAEHKFTYNGKEKQDQFGLGWLDYHARQVDPAVGRMWGVDPLAHQMRRWSPYAYAFNNPMRFIDPDGMMPYPIGDYFKGLVNRAKQAAVNKVRELTINTLKAIVKTAKNELAKINVTPYAKFEGKATLGKRVALEAKKGAGFDFNSGSSTVISASVEIDNKGSNPEASFLGERKNQTETKEGFAVGQPIGAIGPVPVVANASSSIEQLHDKKTGQLVSTKVEGSASLSPAGSPFGVFLTGEHTARASGASTSVLRAAPFNFGGTIGAFVVLEANVSFGFKMEYNHEKE